MATVEGEPWEKHGCRRQHSGTTMFVPESDPEQEETPKQVQESRIQQEVSEWLVIKEVLHTKTCFLSYKLN